ncbi:MAG: GreA/GreB family elongation factor [Bacteroidetes bacterium]|nr:GreA/GreB family elongation factor [Bacteroidota bacterium]MBS1628916.1 GreA/GreB family elongation factor [Bacteroidota bacterium]
MKKMLKKKERNPVIITEHDYRLIKRYITQAPAGEGLALEHELERAIIVHKYAFPPHTVAMNSRVSVQEMASKKSFELTIVAPHQADASKRMISILSPLGTALIGFRKGQEVEWRMPGGMRKFLILEVENTDEIHAEEPTQAAA